MSGWRRQGDSIAEIAGKMGISTNTLRRWSLAHEEIRQILLIDKDTANFMVEDVLFNKSLAGDSKAYEFWLKHRMPGRWSKEPAKEAASEGQGDFVRLAELINNPVEREGGFE